MLFQKLPSLIIMTFVFALAMVAKAETPATALSFKTWKEQQILLAQNRLLRATAELENYKNTKTSKSAGDEKSSKNQKALTRFQKSHEKTTLERLEKDVSLSEETVKTANELILDDYITVYLPTLTQTPEALETLVDSMSREEISTILREILKKQSDQKEAAPRAAAKLSGFWADQVPGGR